MQSVTGDTLTVVDYHLLIRAFSQMRDVENTLAVFDTMRKNGLRSNSVTWDIVLQAYVYNNDIPGAERLLVSRREAGCSYTGVTYGHMIELCEKAGDPQGAEVWWKRLYGYLGLKKLPNGSAVKISSPDMKRTNVTGRTFNRLIRLNTAKQTPNMERAAFFYNAMISSRIKPTLATFQSMLVGFGTLKDSQSASQLYKRMRYFRIEPDVVFMSAWMDIHASKGDVAETMAALDELKRRDIKPDTTVYNILIKAYGKAGNLKSARNIHSEMIKGALGNNVRPNYWTYTTLIDIALQNHNEALAEEYLSLSQKQGTAVPRSLSRTSQKVLYTNLMRHRIKSGDLKTALRIFQEMRNNGLPLDGVIYKTLVDGFVKNGDLEGAIKLIEQRKELDTESLGGKDQQFVSHENAVDADVWAVVVDACRARREMDRLRDVLQRILDRNRNLHPGGKQSMMLSERALAVFVRASLQLDDDTESVIFALFFYNMGRRQGLGVSRALLGKLIVKCAQHFLMLSDPAARDIGKLDASYPTTSLSKSGLRRSINAMYTLYRSRRPSSMSEASSAVKDTSRFAVYEAMVAFHAPYIWRVYTVFMDMIADATPTVAVLLRVTNMIANRHGWGQFEMFVDIVRRTLRDRQRTAFLDMFRSGDDQLSDAGLEWIGDHGLFSVVESTKDVAQPAGEHRWDPVEVEGQLCTAEVVGFGRYALRSYVHPDSEPLRNVHAMVAEWEATSGSPWYEDESRLRDYWLAVSRIVDTSPLPLHDVDLLWHTKFKKAFIRHCEVLELWELRREIQGREDR
ncbi:hypothetical protein HDU85_006828 [Gaertneriomyces sp. JEL0708]|nr:hypothetical protein HDU85_006828 [Gaertneriomyces sp. JEL0708]